MAYEVIYWHDDEDNAATDSLVVGPFPSWDAALDAANHPPADRWNGGAQIVHGWIIPGKLGVRPDVWEDDPQETPWYVYEGVVQR